MVSHYLRASNEESVFMSWRCHENPILITSRPSNTEVRHFLRFWPEQAFEQSVHLQVMWNDARETSKSGVITQSNVIRITKLTFFISYSISQEICTRFLLWCALLWLYIAWFFPYPSGLLHWHCVPAKQPWWIWINTKHNKPKHNKTVCIFLGIYCTTSRINRYGHRL